MQHCRYNQEGPVHKEWFIGLQGSMMKVSYGPLTLAMPLAVYW